MSKRGLGKGLSAIINTYSPDLGKSQEDRDVIEIPIKLIDPNPYQPRKNFSDKEIKELASSIKSKGLIQPIIVKPNGNRYILVAGERRLRAVKSLGWEKIRAIVYNYSEDEMLEIALIENIQREDLTPIEEAEGYKLLMDKYGYTQEEIAKIVGKDRATISNFLRLLKLPKEVKSLINSNKLSQGHARALLSIGDKKLQISLASRIISEGWSVRKVEDYVRSLKSGRSEKETDKKDSTTERKNRFLRDIEKKLQEFFMSKVVISGSQDRGKIEIYYHSKEELDNIMSLLDI